MTSLFCQRNWIPSQHNTMQKREETFTSFSICRNFKRLKNDIVMAYVWNIRFVTICNFLFVRYCLRINMIPLMHLVTYSFRKINMNKSTFSHTLFTSIYCRKYDDTKKFEWCLDVKFIAMIMSHFYDIPKKETFTHISLWCLKGK